MPELPEVETIVRHTRDRLVGRRIADFRTRWAPNSSPSAAAIRRGVRDRTIVSVGRRGKFILWHLDDGGYAAIHLRMSGRLELCDEVPAVKPRHIRAEFTFQDGGRIVFCDARKFGRIWYVRNLRQIIDTLGIEPLEPEFTPAELAKLLRERSRCLKPLLLDQSVVAGLGNIYTDEALHRARLHPATRSDALTAADAQRLHEAICAVLADGIDRRGTTIDWVYPSGEMQDYLRVYGRAGESCTTCGTVIRRIVIGQRGTHICPQCQAAPRRRKAAARRR